MDETQLKLRIKGRMCSMKYCADTAKHLASCPVLPGSISASGVSRDEEHRLSIRSIAYMLHCIVLELAIKVMWELEKREACKDTHRIDSLYKDLDCTSQSDLRRLFDEKAQLLADSEGTMEGKQIRYKELIQFQSWEDTLAANRDVMVNFKYDGEFKGKSTAMGGVMWDGETVWALQPINGSFPEAVHRYTMDRVEKSGWVT